MKLLSGDEIKNVELDILLFFDEFCKNNGLRYYLAGGTLLGAIRHKGFIPWDDDIDVCMSRNDYMKLQKLFHNGRYEIKSNLLENFDAPFTKIVDTKTIIDSQFVENNVIKNLWIDVFPVDGLPEELDEVQTIYHKCNFLRKQLVLCNARLGEGKTVFKKLIKYILKPLVRIYGVKKYIKDIERIAAKYPYESSKYVGIVTWGLYGVGERMLKSEFEQVVYVDFEGYKFPAFKCWDSYLRGLYHDYMKLPPVEKRKTHDMVAYIAEEEKR